ncbi:Tudor domain [Macleaya cordata]|uniref:Tudor domain n=1 Tax=Macleaya cordata TaxID=56857 RepID=A0A200PT24_MACCD|nr:Tudor domain [Macleaya cordata]
MASSAEKALENQLMEAGKKLLTPPSSVEELLPLLDQVEHCLSRVEQSPSGSMLDALCDSMKALVSNELLRHSDMDVKVALASCISEITRITAPEAPYSDDQMKEIFQLIVVAFEKLFDTSSRSYSKRVSILETVAKVRSCVVMLDLECDALILDMFRHFLKAIRENHPDNVFSSMETIMTLVLEESEEISSELLCPLLTSVKKENQDVLPIAKRLAEKVLENCAAKLKPYLMQAVQSMGTPMHDYSKVVASICHETVDNVEHNDGSASEEHLADQKKITEGIGSEEAPQADQKKITEGIGSEEAPQVDQKKMQEMIGSDEAPQVAEELKPEVASSGAVDSIVEKSQKSVMSNGSAQTGNSDSLMGLDSLEKKELSHSSTPLTEDEPNINSKIVNSETNPDHIVKRTRDQKPNSSMPSAEASDKSLMDSNKEAGEHADGRKSRSAEANSSPSKDLCTDEAIVHSENEKKTQIQLASPTVSQNETVNAASPSPSQSLLEETNPKKGQRSKKKKNSKLDSDPDSSSVPKGAFSNEQTEDEAPPSADVISKKKSKANKDSDSKEHLHSGRKAKANEDKNPSPVDDISMKESVPASDSEPKPVRRSSKKVDERTSKEDEPSLDKQEVKTRKGRETMNSKKEVTGEPSNKEKVSSLKSTKSSNKDGSHLGETPNTQSKRKRTSGKEVALETPNSVKDLGEDVVGSKIKVWWPLDKKFYEGTIESFDSVKKKHKVVYIDGEIEVLNLKKQRFEFVRDDTVPEMGQATEFPSPDSSEMPQNKRAKTDLDSPTLQPKTNTSARRRGGSSTSKSKGAVTKSDGGKSKESTSKPTGKYKDDSSSKSKNGPPKSSSKLKKEEAQIPGSKSKDETSSKPKDDKDGTPKTSNKVKESPQKRGGKSKVKDDDATPKTSSKTKGETANTSSKSSANGTSAKKGKSGSLSKVQEGSSKGKSAKAEESSGKKAQESATKRGRKRPRRVNS